MILEEEAEAIPCIDLISSVFGPSPLKQDGMRALLLQHRVPPDKIDKAYEAYLAMENAASKHEDAVSMLIIYRDERHIMYANHRFREFEKKRVAFVKFLED